jgi:predicted outer membrane repeat protein
MTSGAGTRDHGWRTTRRAGAAAVALAIASIGLAAPSHAAAVIYVAPSGSGGGSCATPDAHTIAGGIALAASGDTVHVCAGTYQLLSGADEIVVDKTLNVEGAGSATTFVDGMDATRVFRVVAPATGIAVSGLTIRSGLPASGNGGAISAAGAGMTVSVTDSAFWGNTGAAGGGAIFADGDVTAAGSTFTSNGGSSTQYGGAIYSQGGDVTLTNSTFMANSATAASSGGGAVQGATITAVGSTFESNSTLMHGGALLAGYVEVSGSTFLGNIAPGTASDGLGGAIWAGSVTATTSTFESNAAAGGGAIGASGGIVTGRSTFVGNVATLYGGAVYSTGSVIQAWNSTFTDNGAVAGGALMAGGSMALASLTFAGNVASVGSSILTGGPASTSNSIFADGGGWGCQLTGAVIDNGGSLATDGTCPGTAATEAELALGALADNGGPTMTMALGTTSSAIDAGINAPCTGIPDEGIDQRGATRPQGKACDSGAYEAGVFDAAEHLPPPWLQAYGRSASVAACADGYSPSWAQWPNAGAGGFTCERSTVWDPNKQAWVEKPGFVFRSRTR